MAAPADADGAISGSHLLPQSSPLVLFLKRLYSLSRFEDQVEWIVYMYIIFIYISYKSLVSWLCLPTPSTHLL